MIKTSFTVGYMKFIGNEVESHVVLGVTSIVPNLNGILFFTEDGENHFVESHELRFNTLAGMLITYNDMKDYSTPVKVHDHRER